MQVKTISPFQQEPLSEPWKIVRRFVVVFIFFFLFNSDCRNLFFACRCLLPQEIFALPRCCFLMVQHLTGGVYSAKGHNWPNTNSETATNCIQCLFINQENTVSCKRTFFADVNVEIRFIFSKCRLKSGKICVFTADMESTLLLCCCATYLLHHSWNALETQTQLFCKNL